MKKILVTGALGQIGSELVSSLRDRYGADQVIASDIRMLPPESRDSNGPFEFVDCTKLHQVREAVQRHDVGTIFHLAALLSAVGEEKPQVAWDVNMGGVYRVLEVARQSRCAVFFPSSIAAFGSSTPAEMTPQDTIQRPSTIYGVTKVSGELLCDYYFQRFGVDTRGVRFPGLISHVAKPGGGTTDYAVEIFYEAIRNHRYTCLLQADTRLDMMYMPDALRASMELMETDPTHLVHRNSFNVSAMNFTPEELAEEIRRHIPDFTIDYEVDSNLQKIADTWPDSVDDSAARSEWGWSPEYDLGSMTTHMLERLEARISRS